MATDVVATNSAGTDAASLVDSVAGTGNIDLPAIFKINGSLSAKGAHITGVGTTSPVNTVGLIIVGTKNFDVLESSPSFSIGRAVVRDASKGAIEVSLILRELR